MSHLPYLSYVYEKKASYPGRSYYGPPEYECAHCSAVFWFHERSKRHSSVRGQRFVYNNCCRGGKVYIPPFREPPSFLAELLNFAGDARSKIFLRNIRQYNCLFAFTSMGANVDQSMNTGGGPYVFKINGQVHHRIGSLVPPTDSHPRFVELYIYDTDNEVANRMRALDRTECSEENLDSAIVAGLIHLLNEHNPLVKQFRLARDRLEDSGNDSLSIRIIGARPGDPVQYNLPTCDELALLVVGDFSLETYKRDIVVHNKSRGLQRISPLHPAFMALQYPLLFPYG